MNKERAQQILDRFPGKRVLVVGDVMLDEYVWGKVSRVSPEAPVMVVDADHHTFVPGGAANVVNNLCAMGAVSSISGLIGQDGAAHTLTQKLTEEGTDIRGLVSTPARPTTLKTRVIAHSQQGSQQVVRVDHESRAPIDAQSQKQVQEFLGEAIPACDAVLLSDYQKGLLTRDLVKSVVDTARHSNKTITGNIKPQGIGGHCRLTMITLNVYEAGEASGFMLGDGGEAYEGAIQDAGRLLLRKSGAENLLITRSAHGLTLFGSGGEIETIPAHPVEVFDGTGAGDTVISTLTLALTAGATPREAVVLANCAGAVVVRKVGVATAARDEILETVTDGD